MILDDTLRNHPDLHSNDVIKDGMNRIVNKSGSSVYASSHQNFSTETNGWRNRFPTATIETVPYILSKPEMDFAISQFRLILCITTPDNDFLTQLRKQAGKNQQLRIWKP